MKIQMQSATLRIRKKRKIQIQCPIRQTDVVNVSAMISLKRLKAHLVVCGDWRQSLGPRDIGRIAKERAQREYQRQMIENSLILRWAQYVC
jgi:hypothetical protein